MSDLAAETPPEKSGLWEDFIDIFYHPSAVFERRRDGQFGLAMLILVVLWAVLYFALQNGLGPITDAEVAKQIAAMSAKNPSMTAEQLSGARGMMEKFAMFGAIIFIPVGLLLTGLILWLAGKIVDAKVMFAGAMVIAVYSMVPRLVELVLNALQGLFLAPESITSRFSVSFGPARFLPADTNPAVMTLLGGFDLFTIWTVVLMAIGVSVIARVPRSRGAIAAILVWVVGLLPGLFQALSS